MSDTAIDSMKETDNISIVLVDDNITVRRQLVLLLRTESDMVVIGEGNNGLEGYSLVQQLHPDILLIDVVMPVMNGIEVTRKIFEESFHTRVIVLSMYDDEAYVLEALRAGAKGYVLKGDPSHELLKAIREVIKDRYYLSSSLSESAIEKHAEKARSDTIDPYEMLTFTEREVIQMVVRGWDDGKIASKLSADSRIIESYRSSIMRKLNLCTDADLVFFAVRRGLTSPNITSQYQEDDISGN